MSRSICGQDLLNIPGWQSRHVVAGSEQLSPLIRRWILRLLVPCGAVRAFAIQHGFEVELTDALGIDTRIDCQIPAERARLMSTVRKMHRKEETRRTRDELAQPFRGNIERLMSLVGLNVVERQILEFTVHIHTQPLLSETANGLGDLSWSKACHVIATVLAVPDADVRKALSDKGTLGRTGLVGLSRNNDSNLSEALVLPSQSFAELVVTSEADPIDLMRDTVQLARSPTLSLANFEHVRMSLQILKPYLADSLQERRSGVNIFIHGVPGTGKSELARVLAAELGMDLFEIGNEDSEGEPITGERRLGAFRAVQSFFTQRQALLVFDEAEDVFSDGDTAFGFKSSAQKHKGWINRALEDNPVPTIWLSNKIDCLDPAFVRRFDMVFELPVPPRAYREKIVRAACPDFLDAASVARVARAEQLAPAVVTRASSVIETIRGLTDELDPSAAFEHLLSNTLRAQGHPSLQVADARTLPSFYDIDCLRTDTDLAIISREVATARNARLCLYGPPGTGKTALGQWLAQKLEIPLHVRRASDLMDMYVGNTEKKIAACFREAEDEGALLLIDEVDSFLQDRRNARASWEISHVNEMLTQMEAFNGIFIATTNLMDGLDQAALRRFDLKIRFDFVSPSQGWKLFERACASIGLAIPSEALRPAMARLARLTPGDFATVLRQHRFRPLASSATLVSALAAEVALKEGGRAVGFV